MVKCKNPRRYSAMLIAIVLLLSMPMAAHGASTYSGADLGREIEATGAYLVKAINNPSYGTVGGDWAVLGLLRSGLKLPAGYTDKYIENVEKVMAEKKGQLTRNKYSDYSRLILAFTALGKNPTDVKGYDLTEKLSDLEKVKIQGINGPIYALLAFDSLDYSIPQSSAAAVQTTRELLIDSILQRELPAGGFSLSGSVADPDVTAAALQALSNYKGRSDVKAAIDRGLTLLSSVQTNKGGFSGWTTDGRENAESIVQVILALTSLGIDPAEDGRFIKADEKGKKYTIFEALGAFRLKDGSYCHLSGEDADLMATEQALMALVSYERLLAGKGPLFKMKDAGVSPDSQGPGYKYKVMLNGKYMTFSQAPINTKGRILVPMRGIFEALGAKVDWNDKLRLVTGTLSERKIQLKIGESVASVDGTEIKLAVPAMILNGSTLVPLRFISESLEAQVDWDPNTNTAIISKE
ncbi:hypothetical protein MASR2M70_21380 [Bacillota bacterium]